MLSISPQGKILRNTIYITCLHWDKNLQDFRLRLRMDRGVRNRTKAQEPTKPLLGIRFGRVHIEQIECALL